MAMRDGGSDEQVGARKPARTTHQDLCAQVSVPERMRSPVAAVISRGCQIYTLYYIFIDYILNSGIMKNKPFAAWLVAELLFAELRPEPSFLT